MTQVPNHTQAADEPIVIGDSARVYVNDLLASGLYGDTFSEVVEAIILRGVREAIDMKIIRIREF